MLPKIPYFPSEDIRPYSRPVADYSLEEIWPLGMHPGQLRRILDKYDYSFLGKNRRKRGWAKRRLKDYLRKGPWALL